MQKSNSHLVELLPFYVYTTLASDLPAPLHLRSTISTSASSKIDSLCQRHCMRPLEL